MDLPPSLLPFLQPFSQQMTRPAFASLCHLLTGWLFARRHHVAGAPRVRPGRLPKHFSAYHRLLARCGAVPTGTPGRP